jgi:hypothetical protein
MDDNNFATSQHEPDPYFASEVPDEPVDTPVPEAPVEVDEPEEVVDEAPKSTREALEQAYAKIKGEEKEAAAPQPAAAPEVEVPPVEIGAGPKAIKAPASWKPAAREKFDSLPEEVKQEVARREYETDATLAKTAQERRLAHEFMQIASPYAADYQAVGMNPMQAVQQFFQYDRALRTGSVVQKAQLVGNMIREYGIDLVALDNHLAGHVPQETQRPGYDPELAARLERMERFAYEQQQSAVLAQQNQLNTTIEQFASDPKNEFFNDVAPHMVGLLQSGAARDLKEAYEAACYANPQVRQVLSQRQQANQARMAAGSASLPVKGPRNGPAPTRQKFSSTREALEAAFAEQEQGRV